MQYLWNTGALSHRLAELVRNETGIPLFVADHPVPQDYENGMSDSYDEGAAIMGGYVALCSEREVTTRERELLSDLWTGRKRVKGA